MDINEAIRIVYRMPLWERQTVRDFFDRRIPATDPVWKDTWAVPATEIGAALRLVSTGAGSD